MYLIKTFLITSIPVAIIAGLISSVFYDISECIRAGIEAGGLFGTLITVMVLIARIVSKINGKKTTLDSAIIYQDAANHFKNGEGVGGWLMLTENELYFKSHSFNFQNHEKKIPLEQIAEVKTSWTLGFVPNGLDVVSNRGINKFVVYNRKRWIKKIETAIEQQKRNAQTQSMEENEGSD